MASLNAQQKFPFRYDTVFDALVDVLQSKGMTVKTRNKVIGRINARAGMSLFSRGENMTLVVEKIDESNAIVGVEPPLGRGANFTGEHRQQKYFNKIVQALSRYLQYPNA